MENVASDIPIYKIYHIRSPNIIKPPPNEEEDVVAHRSSDLSPEYNVIYVFYGNVEFMADEGRIVDINDVFLQPIVKVVGLLLQSSLMDSGGEPSPTEGGLAPATGGRRNKRRSSILKMPVTRGVLQVDFTIFRESL